MPYGLSFFKTAFSQITTACRLLYTLRVRDYGCEVKSLRIQNTFQVRLYLYFSLFTTFTGLNIQAFSRVLIEVGESRFREIR